MASKFVAKVGTFFEKGTFLYSSLIGVGVGTVLVGGVLAGRFVKVALFDSDYYLQESRKRYLEKQLVFMKSLEEKLKMQKIAEMVTEYQPAHLVGLNGEKIDAKY
jgi:hypothetical protein